MTQRPGSRAIWNRLPVVTVAWGVLCVALFAIAIPRVESPGLYYDEAFMAQQARGFVEPDRAGVHPPGTSSTWILGRPFPLRNAAYLGSLKSQLLIPWLAMFGSSIEVLRLATLGVGLLGLGFAMLWARGLFGERAALLCGLLVVADPSFLFFSQYEWGPFTTLLLCRGLGLYLVTEGFRHRRGLQLALGGLVLGLGVYCRADFAVILAAAGAALALAHRGLLMRALREQPVWLGVAALALLVGASPMLLSVAQLLQTSTGIAHRGDLIYKAWVLASVLDGSHFYRVIEVGGLFDQMFDGDAPTGPLGWAAAICALWLAGRLLADALRRRAPPAAAADAPDEDPSRFLVITTLLLTAGMLAMPGAVRAHHMLNLLPLPHLIVAVVAVELWQGRRHGGGAPARTRGRLGQRVAALGVVAAILVGDIAVTARTYALIDRTGGRGRWSDALTRFAREIDTDASNVVVSFDWGFHEPLLFLTARARSLEPIWSVPAFLTRGRPFVHAGDERHVYLVHDQPYDLFYLGPKLLRAARSLGREGVEIRPHLDREGVPAFYSIRLAEPHRLSYTGEFQFRFP